MCGRFLTEEDDEMDALIELSRIGDAFKYGEVFPTNIVPVVTGAGTAAAMKWGFPGFAPGKPPLINARSETIATTRTFRKSFFERKCLVPATAYYEWRPLPSKKKDKYEFALADRKLIFMAGIYTENGEFAILTRDATPEFRDIHERMPVIIPRERHAEWFNGKDVQENVTELEFAKV
ncbi:MAG: SOS response-associated peptidase [Oscillospiraceae bacterium]|jgi:putative SOS response-associated peptidase YedK|nr:SOS response-associated peptidase [Oscillospiraceae bacterium]